MTGFRRTIFAILAGFYFLTGCGASSPPATTEIEVELDGSANQFIDWDQEDGKFLLPFMPYIYPESTRFDNLKFDTPYEDFTHYRARFEPLNLDEFRALPKATQIKRRRASGKTLQDAMAFHRIMIWSWEIWCSSRKKQISNEIWFYDYGIITPAIMNLEQAAGEDPSNPFTWQHLGFFTGLVGNNNRQLQALDHGFAALADYEKNHPQLSPEKFKELHLMRLRMLLDRAWVLRDKARFDDGMIDVRQALNLMANDEFKTLDSGREALLLQALLLVDQGHYYEARIKANQFMKWNLPIFGSAGGSTPMTKQNLDHTESDFCKHWVWDLTHMKLGNKSRALRPPGYLTKFPEYPPHLGYRFWQDMGRIREHFGQREKAWAFYFLGYLNRPFLTFFPTRITMGYTPVFGQNETGNFHFLGYHDYFLGGSDFGYAANRVAAMERAFGKDQIARYGQQALEALTTCREKGIRPLSSLALRGYVHTMLDEPALAELDLQEVDRLFTETGNVDPQVIRLLATLSYNQRNYRESHELMVRYLKLKPNDASSWRFDAVILAEMDQFNEGLAAMDTALEMEPDSTPGLYNHALIQLHLGQVDKARKDLQKAKELAPGNREISRLAQLVRDDPLTKIEFKHQPRKWSISPRDSSYFQHLNPAIGLSDQELLALIEKLQEDYAGKPSQESRLALVSACTENRQWEKVQKLLIPLWPHKITLEGTLFLLQADRALGYSGRAEEMAHSLTTESGLVADPRLWTLVAVVCHESGKKDSGNSALELALELDPDNHGLLKMQEQLALPPE